MVSTNVERTLTLRRFLLEGYAFNTEARAYLTSERTMNIFYIIGVVVVILVIAGYLGLHV